MAMKNGEAPTAEPVPIPTSAANANKPGLHAQISPDALSQKPHQSSPPRPKSPMPPMATLTDAGMTMLKREGSNTGQSGAAGGVNGAGQREGGGGDGSTDTTGGISPAAKAANHQASSSLPIPSPPAEVEATLSKLTAHANVAGVLVLSRPEALVIRSGGAYFDPSGPGASDRAVRLKAVVEMVRNTVQGLERDVPKSEMGDELSFLRIRTKKYEMMVSPSDKYLLVVIQDPTVST